MKMTVIQLVRGALIAALYTVLTVALAPISFGGIQFRVSEALTVLPFILPEAVWGLTLGCFLANWFAGTILDIIFGTLATFVAAIITLKIRKMWLAPLPAVISNALIVPVIVILMTMDHNLTFGLYVTTALSVGLSEFVICYCGGIPLLIFVNGLLSKGKIGKKG